MDASRNSLGVQTYILGNKTSFNLVKDSDLNFFDIISRVSGDLSSID